MRKYVVDSFCLILGNLLLAIAVTAFILPSDILSGGVAGIAVILKPFIPLPQTIVISILIYALFLVGWIFLGHRFAANTLMSSILYPTFLNLCSQFLPTVKVHPFLAAIYGGLVGGVGIGLVIRRGASTGGMDIPPLILHKYFHFELSKTVLCIDGLTVLSGLFAYDLQSVLIGLLSVFSASFAIDKMLTSGTQPIMSVQIITRHHQEISRAIQDALTRGVTLFEAEGGYTGEKKKVVFVVIGKRQFHSLCEVVESVDPNAFLIASPAQEVHGNGFTLGPKI